MLSARDHLQISLVAVFGLSSGCQELEVLQQEVDVNRGIHFGDSDRLFVDEDGELSCFNTDFLTNNNVTAPNGQPDLRRSPRQEAGSQRMFGPLPGGDACSQASKAWSGGYYKTTGMPTTMGDWCRRYGFSSDCQTAIGFVDGDVNQPLDLHISYYNSHALPVRRVTVCNNKFSIRREGTENVRVIRDERGFTNVGFACVNLNYACPERVQGGIRPTAEVGLDRPFEERVCDITDPQFVGDGAPNCGVCEAVSVTMHYDFVPGSDKPIVVFAGYRGVTPDAPLMDRIDLDFSGKETVIETIPNICINCHGSKPYEPGDIENPTVEDVSIQAQFLPINPRYALRDFEFNEQHLSDLNTLVTNNPNLDVQALYEQYQMRDTPLGTPPGLTLQAIKDLWEADPGAGIPLTGLVRGSEQVGSTAAQVNQPLRLDLTNDLFDAFEINRLIIGIDTLPVNADTMRALERNFAVDRNGNASQPLALIHVDDEVPSRWSEARDIYPVVAEHCNDSCHLALQEQLQFETFAEFREHRDITLNELCRDYSMPQSPESFNLLWSKSRRVGNGTRGDDLERLLEFSAPGWAPLVDELENGLADCPPPPLAITFLGAVEFTSPVSFEAKRAECIEEAAAERERGGAIATSNPFLTTCRAICSNAILGDEQKFNVSRDAFNRPTCAALGSAIGLVVDD